MGNKKSREKAAEPVAFDVLLRQKQAIARTMREEQTTPEFLAGLSPADRRIMLAPLVRVGYEFMISSPDGKYHADMRVDVIDNRWVGVVVQAMYDSNFVHTHIRTTGPPYTHVFTEEFIYVFSYVVDDTDYLQSTDDHVVHNSYDNTFAEMFNLASGHRHRLGNIRLPPGPPEYETAVEEK